MRGRSGPTTAVPQAAQKRAFGGRDTPHEVQAGGVVGVPHAAQKRAPGDSGSPQAWQLPSDGDVILER